ncbi:MAG: glycosyltransferase family 39 protein, partial [bacterium]|nr:glycosyltransferase family 39 protein [bacterium]
MTSGVVRSLRHPSPLAVLIVCVAIIAGMTVLRGIFAATIDLRVDEAYYWAWSRERVLSYLDHPPMIAWCIRAGTALFGDSNFGVRFPGLVFMLCVQLLLADIVRRLVHDIRCVAFALLMPEAALHYGLGMAKVTPDIALIPIALAMVWSLVRLWQTDDLRWWLLAGLFGGLAMLSKYTVILLLPAILAFALVPDWRRRHLASPWFWLSGVVALLVASPMLYWNGVHDWISFRFQLDRPDQIDGWSVKFLGDFLGQQLVMIGILLLPILMIATVMMAVRGYRNRAPVPILLSTAVLFPFGFFLWHGVDSRVGDSWLLFAWPFGFLCAAVNLRQWHDDLPSLPPRTGQDAMIAAMVSGIALVAAVEVYYVAGTANYLGKNDPIGKEAGFAAVVAEADAKRKEIGAAWFVTTDYRMYAMLRWHLRDAEPVVQLNERSRYIGFREPRLDGPVGLYLEPQLNRAALWDSTGALRQTVGTADLVWR